MTTLSTRTRYTPKNIPLILTLSCLSLGFISAGVYLLGVGFLTLLDIVGAWL